MDETKVNLKFNGSNITKTRIIIFDESPLMRNIISEIFSNDRDIEIVGTFKTFNEIKKFLNEINYVVDCVITNIISDKEDFINVLLYIKHYTFNIVFISNLSMNRTKMLEQVLEFKDIRFVDYSGKLNLTSIGPVKESIKKEVYSIKMRRIKRALFDGKRAIVIASSTGGPKVLEYLFERLRIEIFIPIFIVQHMPDGCTKQFVDRLNKTCNYKFSEARNGEGIKQNMIYIAPGGYHMLVTNGNKIILNQNEAVNNVRPSADILFCSASKVYKDGLLGIVLTGMGRDASAGIKCIKENGGKTIVQNEKSCTVFGMPKAAIETGSVDKILPIDEIILEIVKHSGKV